MFTIKNLKIKGFRGYMDEKGFAFNSPVTILSGENHCGKSSALNAIEWCLFGNECIGKDTGIRERIDWEIPNRNLGLRPDVFVELELEDEDKNIYRIRRKWISSRRDELSISAGHEQFQGNEAGEKLAQLVKLSFQDFLTTVYQHQEAVRAVITQEPSNRNEALDRLLGLSVYRNILTGIDAVKISTKQKDMEKAFDDCQNRIRTIMETRSRDLEDMKKQAVQKGLKEAKLNENGALDIARTAKKELEGFASELRLGLSELRLPEQWKNIYLFQKAAEDEIKRLRAEMPDAMNQKALFEQQSRLTQLKTEYDSKKGSVKAIEKELEELSREKGKEEDLEHKKLNTERDIFKKEIEMSEGNARAAAISKALEYLQSEEVNKNICPVCGKETADLLMHLKKEWKDKYEKQAGKIQDEIIKLKIDLNNTISLLNKFKELKDKKEESSKALSEVNEKISRLLSRAITDKDDASVIINNELNQIQKGLKGLEVAVKSKQERLYKISGLLEQAQVIVNILTVEEKKTIIDKITQSDEFRQMDELKDKMAFLSNDIGNIKSAINTASNEDAKGKIDSAKEMIDRIFRKITNNPAVSRLALQVSPDSKGKNNYEFKDQNDKEITPILSQGDLNALALSIFLGIAHLEAAEQPCGFIMLDDPSQSLGSEHKGKLVEVINEVLDNRMVILSTMDKELQDLIILKITKSKTQYIFDNWTPQGGPEIRMD